MRGHDADREQPAEDEVPDHGRLDPAGELDLVGLELAQEGAVVGAGDAHHDDEDAGRPAREAGEPLGPRRRRVRHRLLEDSADLALAEGDPGHAILAHPLDQAAHRDLLRLGCEEPALEEDQNDDSDGNVENGEARLLTNAGFHRRITAEKCYRRGQPLSNRGRSPAGDPRT